MNATKTSFATMTKHTWTPQQADQLASLYPHTPGPELAAMLGVPLGAVYNKAWSMGLKKTRATIAAMARAALADPAHPARKSQFQPGLTPWNKGKPFDSGGRSHETRFKRGRAPSEARNYVPIGSLRVSKDGYLERKMNDTHPTPACRWTAVHRLVWEAANGPIPDRHIVIFKPGQKTAIEADVTVDRLECISRAEHAYRNSARSKNPELVKLVQLKGAITRQVNRINREHAESRP